MKIALIGYGKMGKEIEKIALERNHTVSAKIDTSIPGSGFHQIKECDVAIEFTTPKSAVENILKCFEKNVPVVVGTTGWYDKFDNISKMAKKSNQALFHATNYSVGVNLFFELNKQIALLMNNYPDYKISMEETHHVHKADAPSGTAITTAERILEIYSHKNNWALNNAKDEQDLVITCIRKDEVPGTHTVTYKSEVDELSFTHLAYNRKGFALGAVLAAEWIVNKKGVFSMSDMLKIKQ